MGTSYPLESLATVRAAAESEAERALAEGVRLVDAARVAREEARGALADFRARENERRTGVAAPRLGVDLIRESAYRARQDEREDSFVARMRAAAKRESCAEAEVQAARAALQEAGAERLVVDRHHEKWRGEKARAAQKKADDDADENNLRRR